jgi:hypothetical protein
VPLHPHRLRSSWAVRAEVDLVDLMALAGWESADMARRYKSEGEAELAEEHHPVRRRPRHRARRAEYPDRDGQGE